MQYHSIIDTLKTLRCQGMAEVLSQLQDQQDSNALSFEEKLTLMVEREQSLRDSKNLRNRLRRAKLKSQACLENIDYSGERGLSKTLMAQFEVDNWIRKHANILITGATGTGKSYLACALSHKACLLGFNALYVRVPKLIQSLHIARHDGSYLKLINSLEKPDVLVLDDWGLVQLDTQGSQDLLEVFESRYQHKSCILTSQVPTENWYDIIPDKTFADALLDRIIHADYRIELKGESLRKKQALSLLNPE